MSLHPEPVGEVPAETARVSRAAFPKGTLITRLRDEFSALYQDEDFVGSIPPGASLALRRGALRWSRCSSSWSSSAIVRPLMPCGAGSIGSMLAAGNVAPHGVDREVPVPEHDPGKRLDLDVDKGRLLVLGEVPDLRLGKPDVLDVARRQLRKTVADFLVGEPVVVAAQTVESL